MEIVDLPLQLQYLVQVNSIRCVLCVVLLGIHLRARQVNTISLFLSRNIFSLFFTCDEEKQQTNLVFDVWNLAV